MRAEHTNYDKLVELLTSPHGLFLFHVHVAGPKPECHLPQLLRRLRCWRRALRLELSVSLSGVGVFERLASIALLWSRMYKPFCALALAGDVVFAALWQALVGERLVHVHVRRRPTWVH
ncbi:hypothetical protein FA95DRAFT_544956 [Auriscalpium vulgare]|uniref:Uncharacterized protein n=1 Tax=Auriscalpium vulgare TaxID=40419 RepID=A0ACB8RET2_9AGAM|nr:hypothetical protein FA95DRAFT_544956 [Auriscalpium vulgare]